MARIINEKEYAERRNEILDVAQRLIYTKGYEQMSVQDILQELGISKGAFYHYFASKSDLLKASIDRLGQQARLLLIPIIAEPHLTALDKLHQFFSAASNWKLGQRDYFLAILRVWYADDNAIVRQKSILTSIQWLSPLLAEIIQQGVQEGIFNTPYPEQVSEVAMTLFTGMGDTVAMMVLSGKMNEAELENLQRKVGVYMDALERILGAPTGSLHLIDIEMLRPWVELSQEPER